MTPPRRLRAGDTVRFEIESIGYIENRVVDEARPQRRLVQAGIA